jgi:uncharacterized protein (DUF1015 family)
VPTFVPFRALRYAPSLRQWLDDLIAPPYDVISDDDRARLAARHSHNIVHLDLPVGSGDETPQVTAGRRLRSWIDDGVLEREAGPAFYLCEQHYRTGGEAPRIRRGLFGRLKLEPFEADVVIPHERTLEAPRRDREALLEATRTHLSAVFLLHPDPGAAVAGALQRIAATATFDTARDDDQVMVRISRLDTPADLEFLQGALRPQWALIADGHHRYESALAYRDRRRAAGRQDAEHVLAFLCSLEDSGLTVYPIHRLVHSLPEFEPAGLRRRLDDWFRLSPVEGPDALLAALRSKGGEAGVFGLTMKDEPRYWLVEWKEGAGLDHPALGELPAALRRLDVILLHRLVLEAALGITLEAQSRQTHLGYVKDEKTLFARIEEGAAQIGFLLNPTPIEQVVEVTRQNLRLPQKTTYFYPKVPSGLVLDPLDG